MYETSFLEYTTAIMAILGHSEPLLRRSCTNLLKHNLGRFVENGNQLTEPSNQTNLSY